MLNWEYSHKPALSQTNCLFQTRSTERVFFYDENRIPTTGSWRIPRVFYTPCTTFHSIFAVCEAEIHTFNFKTIES